MAGEIYSRNGKFTGVAEVNTRIAEKGARVKFNITGYETQHMVNILCILYKTH